MWIEALVAWICSQHCGMVGIPVWEMVLHFVGTRLVILSLVVICICCWGLHRHFAVSDWFVAHQLPRRLPEAVRLNDQPIFLSLHFSSLNLSVLCNCLHCLLVKDIRGLVRPRFGWSTAKIHSQICLFVLSNNVLLNYLTCCLSKIRFIQILVHLIGLELFRLTIRHLNSYLTALFWSSC